MHPLFSSYSDNYVQFSKLYTFTRYLVHAIKIRTFCECSFNNYFKLQCNGQEHYHFPILVLPPCFRVLPRFFDQVGDETMYAFSGNKCFFTKSCHNHSYQNYEQSRQKLCTILENKVCIKNQNFQKNI